MNFWFGFKRTHLAKMLSMKSNWHGNACLSLKQTQLWEWENCQVVFPANMLCLPSIISLCLLLILDNLRYTVCCLGLAGEVMIVLVLIVVIWIMTSGTMGITSRHRQAETESQIQESREMLYKKKYYQLHFERFSLYHWSRTLHHICIVDKIEKLNWTASEAVWVPSVFTLDSSPSQ